MTTEQERLLTPTFLFRFSVPCLYRRSTWSANGVQLEPRFRVPSFGELEGKRLFADTRAAWNKSGFTFTVRVEGKKQAPWCRASRIEDSDGLQVWIDTRDTHTIHRASRYCHRFFFLPAGDGQRMQSPVARWMPIQRAREEPKPVPADSLQVRSERRVDGYILEAHIAANALTGFDPDEHTQLGFTYAIKDRELGWQTFSVGPEFPFESDPSLWGTLELVRGT